MHQNPGRPEAFARGKRGDLFAPKDALRSLMDADGDSPPDDPYVTWATKQFMWTLHEAEPGRWTPDEISKQFGVKLPRVQVQSELQHFLLSVQWRGILNVS